MFVRWVEIESPDGATQLRVIEWIAARREDPTQGVQRELDFPNLWWGRIPGTMDDARTLVSCSYQILARTKIVRCLSIGRVGYL
jgi:hypothetical protein